MPTQAIGNTISDLRKAKGVTQEELARTVGVSTQAVSKWECGGTPDTELLPLIADYFSVSIDRLFGRSVQDYGDVKREVARHISSLDEEDRMREAMEYYWTIQKALSAPRTRRRWNRHSKASMRTARMVPATPSGSWIAESR